MAIAGKKGKVAIGEGDAVVKVESIKSWSLEMSADQLDTTYLGDEWKSSMAGLKEWSASAEGDFDIITDVSGQKALQDAHLAGTSVQVQLFVNETNFYSGTAQIASLSVEDGVEDKVTFSCEFTGNGPLSFT